MHCLFHSSLRNVDILSNYNIVFSIPLSVLSISMPVLTIPMSKMSGAMIIVSTEKNSTLKLLNVERSIDFRTGGKLNLNYAYEIPN